MRRNFRVGLLFKPTDNFQALFKVEINDLSTGGLTPRPLPPCPICAPDSSFYQYGYNGPSIYNGFQNLGVYQLDYNTPEMQNDRADRFSLELRYILPGDITLRSLSGYQNLYEQRVDDADASAAPVGAGGSFWEHTIGPDPYYSQEFDLISPDTGKLTWMTGASYFWRSTPVELNRIPLWRPGGAERRRRQRRCQHRHARASGGPVRAAQLSDSAVAADTGGRASERRWRVYLRRHHDSRARHRAVQRR
jgi:iron complex outermembrane receptor protein